MAQFAFDADPAALAEIEALPCERPILVYDPGDPDFAIAIVRPIRREYGAHVLRLFDRLQLIDQNPSASLQDGVELLRQHLVQLVRK